MTVVIERSNGEEMTVELTGFPSPPPQIRFTECLGAREPSTFLFANDRYVEMQEDR